MIDVAALVVAALVQGMLRGIETISEDAAVDSYRSLRNALARRYGPRVNGSIQQLERDPGEPRLQTAVQQELVVAGAQQDRELLALSRRILNLIENPEDLGSDEGVDPVARIRRNSGRDAVRDLLQRHIERIEDLRNRISIEDTDLLTIRVRANKHLPGDIRQNAATLHGRMREIIEKVALTIENSRYQEVEQAVDGLQTGLAERERAAALVRCDKQIHISYETLRLTVEFFGELNQTVLRNIEDEDSPQRQSTMMFGNAVMIWELADFMISYVREFSVGSEIDTLHADAKKKVAETRTRQQRFKEKILAQQDSPDQGVRDQTLNDIAGRESALDELDAEWDRYLDEVSQLRDKVSEVRGWVPTLEMIRENAELQIETLQLVAMLSFLKSSSRSIDGAVETLKGFRLAPLTSKRVRRLIGV